MHKKTPPPPPPHEMISLGRAEKIFIDEIEGYMSLSRHQFLIYSNYTLQIHSMLCPHLQVLKSEMTTFVHLLHDYIHRESCPASLNNEGLCYLCYIAVIGKNKNIELKMRYLLTAKQDCIRFQHCMPSQLASFFGLNKHAKMLICNMFLWSQRNWM